MQLIHALSAGITLSFAPLVLAQDFFTTPIETGPLAVGIRDFAVLPDSVNGSSSGPARMSMMTTDPLGRLFVNDQRGPIYNLSSTGVQSEYLDIRDFSGIGLTNVRNEQGLQSFAFHPDFANSGAAGFGKLYTVHTSSNTSPTPDFDPGGSINSHTVVLEWSTSNPSGATYSGSGGGAPREVMRLKQPFGNHNAGLIAFNTSVGPADADYGNLYLSIGDGGSGGDPLNVGQDPSDPFGAILRIDPLDPDGIGPLKYSTLNSNVLASDNDPTTLAEIYAFGLRNPQRFGWDDQTGAMFVADIGQREVEEINLVVNGANYGWNEREGSFAYEGGIKTAAMTDPILEYDHTNTADAIPTTITQRAVTLAEVARGTGIGGLDGKLLLADFPTGMIFYADVDPAIPGENAGQDPLAQLQLVDKAGNNVDLLELINAQRDADQRPEDASRTDLRFSMGTAGEIYILNKQDGVVRVLTPVLDGDTDGDGDVDDSDLGTSFANYTGPIGALGGRTWAQGDTDIDGDVDDSDLGTSFANYSGPLSTATVPEPGVLGILTMGLIGLSRRRRMDS